MNTRIRRALALGLAALLLLGGTALGETAAERDGWHLDEHGFLTGENPGEEYLLEDEENGVWQYASRTLSIRVERTREKQKKGKKKILEYCVAEIWCSEESPLEAILSEPQGKKPVPGKHQETPETLLNLKPSILAVSDDMFGLRINPSPSDPKKTKYDYHGVIIRYGEILATKTRKSPEEGKKDKRPWPNLDTLAVYEDGSMRTFVSGDLTAEEYLEAGARHVFAFGPWLIRDGALNPALENPNYYSASEPRAAIGMIEPYHYIVIATGGRPKTKYTGVKLLWLAQMMQERGCVEALNLDGGQTVIMAFNNRIILQGDTGGLRNQGSLIAFGLRDSGEEAEAAQADPEEEIP